MDKNTLLKALSLTAEAKNARMIGVDTRDGDLNSSFSKSVESVYATIKALAEVRPDKRYLEVNQTMYDLAEYNVPKNVLSLINATNIYVNSDSAYLHPIITGTWEAVDEDARILEPAEFNAFWMRWNSNQYNAKVDCVSVQKSVKTIMDVGAILVDGSAVILNDSAEVNELVAKALQLSLLAVTSNNAVGSVIVTDQEVALWLISN